jgi:hydrogenase maturation protein HypF
MLSDERLAAADRAARFHDSMAESVVQQCKLFANMHGEFAVGLGGGVFQNRLLSERILQRLEAEGFRVYLPQRLPCNDGGLCYGQVIEALYHTASRAP